MSDRTIVFVTGANAGLGLEIVKALCRSSSSATAPYHIILGTRTLSNGERAIETVKSLYPSTPNTFSTVQADLTSDASLESAIATITTTHNRLDVLVNNGGVDLEKKIRDGQLSIRDGWNMTWDTNVAGTQVLTTLAVPLLLRSANPRLMFVTSGTSSLTETTTSPNPALKAVNAAPEKGWPKPKAFNPITSYRSSKIGLNMLMREWERILRNDGVKVWCISPGFLATAMSGIDPEQLKKMGAIDPSKGGEFVATVIEGERDHDVGKVIRSDMVQPW